MKQAIATVALKSIGERSKRGIGNKYLQSILKTVTEQKLEISGRPYHPLLQQETLQAMLPSISTFNTQIIIEHLHECITHCKQKQRTLSLP
jgi:hypothetical protein